MGCCVLSEFLIRFTRRVRAAGPRTVYGMPPLHASQRVVEEVAAALARKLAAQRMISATPFASCTMASPLAWRRDSASAALAIEARFQSSHSRGVTVALPSRRCTCAR